MAIKPTFPQSQGGGFKIGKKNKKQLKKYRKYTNKGKSLVSSRKEIDPSRCVIEYGDGVVTMDIVGEVMGIQINYQGNINITSPHDNIKKAIKGDSGWVMCANNKTGVLLYFSTNGEAKSGRQDMFHYRGEFKIQKVIASGSERAIRGISKKHTNDYFRNLGKKFNLLDAKFNSLKKNGLAEKRTSRATGYETNYNQIKNSKSRGRKSRKGGGSY